MASYSQEGNGTDKLPDWALISVYADLVYDQNVSDPDLQCTNLVDSICRALRGIGEMNSGANIVVHYKQFPAWPNRHWEGTWLDCAPPTGVPAEDQSPANIEIETTEDVWHHFWTKITVRYDPGGSNNYYYDMWEDGEE